MSDRSDEVTESRDTDDLLEETERLLSETGAGGGGDTGPAPESRDRPAAGRDPSTTSDGPLEADAGVGATPGTTGDESDASGSSRLSGLGSRLSGAASWLSVEDYFSPRAFLLFVLLVGAGVLGGGTVIPFAGVGRMIGMFGVAFAIGLALSTRRYLEMAAAGTAVGAVSAVLSHAFFAVAGSFRSVIAVGVAVGLVACLGGYYFGRDLRNGLARDIE